jgi:hypothetical protein
MRALLAVLALLWAGPALAECLALPASLSGTLSKQRVEHPNGDRFDAYRLTLDSPIEVAGIVSDGCVKAVIVHVVPHDDAEMRRFERALRRRVTIASPDVFEAHTAWHAGDAVALQAKLQR